MKKLMILSTALLGFAHNAAAQDQGLYDPLPPEGSAFVRFLSESSGTGSVQAKANSKGYDYLTAKQVSSYYIVPQGPVKAEIGAASKDFNAEAGKFYTVVLNEADAIDIKTDPQN